MPFICYILQGIVEFKICNGIVFRFFIKNLKPYLPTSSLIYIPLLLLSANLKNSKLILMFVY